MRNSKFAKTLAMVLVIAMLLTMSSFAFADADGTAASDEGNKHPIVLVHGLFGWGGTEVANLHYWGGYSSLQQMLNDAGYEVYTPSIGPVASNWDRACELYAYLVGGTVDYGQYHSAQNGHARYGRTFKGVLPELNDADSTLKVHLVGHSMGGETIRMLAQLLENGDPDEMRATTDGSINKLFTGECRHWIESITTLCTPHDGSQYDGKVYNPMFISSSQLCLRQLAQISMKRISALTSSSTSGGLSANRVRAMRVTCTVSKTAIFGTAM